MYDSDALAHLPSPQRRSPLRYDGHFVAWPLETPKDEAYPDWSLVSFQSDGRVEFFGGLSESQRRECVSGKMFWGVVITDCRGSRWAIVYCTPCVTTSSLSDRPMLQTHEDVDPLLRTGV